MDEPLRTDGWATSHTVEDLLTGVAPVDFQIVVGELARIDVELARLELWFGGRGYRNPDPDLYDE
jgi:hypothetical protein